MAAVDWSGALDPAAQRRGIWIGDCWRDDRDSSGNARTIQLRSGESRSAAEAFLINAARETPAMVAGIDFSFSYPQAFLSELGCRTAPELWALVSREGERWLTEPHPAFWGRGKGSRRPDGHAAPAWLGYRRTELQARSGNTLPRSSFQIGGAGAVGTASLRGIPMLPRLRAAGFSIWPFDPPRLPLLVEIYPRLLTGPVVKSSAAARIRYLQRDEFALLTTSIRAAAQASEDAFDALVSAWRMREAADEWTQLPYPPDAQIAAEGAIWRPDINLR